MKTIYNRLMELLEHSADRYSKFQVSSIVVTEDGKQYEGVNYESASYGGTICAERNAIGTAITDNMSYGKIKEVHIIARKRGTEKTILARPCGICRQMIAEQSGYDANIFTYNQDGTSNVDTIQSLLPKAFLGGELK